MNTRHFATHPWLRACLLAACVAASAAASAGDSVQSRSMTVRYGDLNLSNPEGVARLYSRIRRAANRVCGIDPGTNATRIGKACRDTAIGDAVKSIDNRILTAMHEQKTSRRFG